MQALEARSGDQHRRRLGYSQGFLIDIGEDRQLIRLRRGSAGQGLNAEQQQQRISAKAVLIAITPLVLLQPLPWRVVPVWVAKHGKPNPLFFQWIGSTSGGERGIRTPGTGLPNTLA